MANALRPRTRILLVEDDDEDFSLTRDMLTEVPGHSYELDWARTCEAGLAAIDSGAHDVCLLDNLLGSHTGLELLGACGGVNAPLPIIMLTGSHDRRIDQATMEAGASDYLLKGQLNPTTLERSIRYATERYRMREKLEQFAKYDSLTGLANRMLFHDFISGAIGRSQRSQRGLALMFLDLDHFKHINDTHGHFVGDALLVEVGLRLKASVRTGDLVARLGGDEFAIVLDDVGSSDDVHTIANNILDVLRPPCTLNGHAVRVSTSIGVVLFPTDGDSPDELVKAADSAMYEAKRHGRDTYRLFATSLKKAAQAASKVERNLADDIAADNILAHYQPQFDIRTGKIVGIEALARWGNVSPEEFILSAERSGLIVELGHNLLHRACTQFSAWRMAGLVDAGARLSVNISAVQLKSDALLSTVDSALKASGLPPQALELELTETAMMEDPDKAVSILERLASLNVRSVMDDFGTGYSSLTYLSHLPIRGLKIDRSFINNIGVNRQNDTIIKTIIGLASNLGLGLVAEGVETEAQSTFLLASDCPVMQGWLYARALAPEILQAQLEAGSLLSRVELTLLAASAEGKRPSSTLAATVIPTTQAKHQRRPLLASPTARRPFRASDG